MKPLKIIPYSEAFKRQFVEQIQSGKYHGKRKPAAVHALAA
jgi:hypothetical protein